MRETGETAFPSIRISIRSNMCAAFESKKSRRPLDETKANQTKTGRPSKGCAIILAKKKKKVLRPTAKSYRQADREHCGVFLQEAAELPSVR